MKISFRKHVSILALFVVACGLNSCSGHDPRGDDDSDGVPNKDDQCPTVSVASSGLGHDPSRNGCPAWDRDSDGVPDHQDVCPIEPMGHDQDPSRLGCPAQAQRNALICESDSGTDCDGDGVINSIDQCPSVPRGAHPSAIRNGCPWEDRDGDQIEDIFDICINERANPIVNGVEVVPDGGLRNDPDLNGCLFHPITDGGTNLVADAGIATDVAEAAQIGHADAATSGDACVTTSDIGTNTVIAIVPAVGPAVIIPVAPTPTPVPAVASADAGTPPVETHTLSGFSVGTSIADTADTATAEAFCLPTRQEVEYAIRHSANRECRSSEASGCWRRASDATQVVDCGTSPTPGCRYPNGRITACVPGAENVIVWRCPRSMLPCTPQNVANTRRARQVAAIRR